jgi:hypothetical protein
MLSGNNYLHPRTIALVVALFIVQVSVLAQAQTPSKPVKEINVYAFRWPNGYSEIDFQGLMTSGVVTNIDPGILGSHLSIDTPETTYHFTVSLTAIPPAVVATLGSYGFVDLSGFDLDWPATLPPLNGPANYVEMNEKGVPGPSPSVLSALKALHSFYDAHRSQLAAAAAVQPSANPSAEPSDSPVSVIKIVYPNLVPK